MHISGIRAGFSGFIDVKRIERESRRLLFIGVLFAVFFHAGLCIFFSTRHPTQRPLVREQPRWAFRADIIEVPRLPREPFRITEHRFAPKSLRRGGFSPVLPSPGAGSKPSLPLETNPPEFSAYAEHDFTRAPAPGSDALTLDGGVPREPDTRIPLRRDASTDPGMFRADIIYNPAEKLAVQGFVHIPLIRSGGFLQTERYIHSLRGLVEGINRHTNIQAVLDSPYEGIRWDTNRSRGFPVIKEAPNERGIRIEALLSCRPPLVYLLADRPFRLNESERECLRRYMDSGGVLVIENAKPGDESLRRELRNALSNILISAFEPIPPDHPFFHCFYDFDGTPEGAGPEFGAVPHRVLPYLEGIWLRGRLIAVYSDRGYGLCWKDGAKFGEQMKMGINLVVYALVQQKERQGHRTIAVK
jgi:hypothetical protein